MNVIPAMSLWEAIDFPRVISVIVFFFHGRFPEFKIGDLTPGNDDLETGVIRRCDTLLEIVFVICSVKAWLEMW